MTSPTQAFFSDASADKSTDALLGRIFFQKFERFARFAFTFAIFAFPVGLVFGFFARDFITPGARAFLAQPQPSEQAPAFPEINGK